MREYKVVKQRGPTCGIYALLNGIHHVYDVNVKAKKTHELVLDLLKKNSINEDVKGSTFVGEFFDFATFMDFIDKSKKLISAAIREKEIEYTVAEKDISFLKSEEFLRALSEKESFALFSLCNRKYESKEHVISHWVAIVGYEDGKYIIHNSNKLWKIKKTWDELQVENDELVGSRFKWDDYKYSSIKSLDSRFTKIGKWVSRRCKLKKQFIENGILPETIDHVYGKILAVQVKKGK